MRLPEMEDNIKMDLQNTMALYFENEKMLVLFLFPTLCYTLVAEKRTNKCLTQSGV
jgi:hypothetical protein